MSEKVNFTVYSHPAWSTLADYLAENGETLKQEWCNSFDAKVYEAYAARKDPETFYEETDVYLYQNTGFALAGYKRPYYGVLFQMIGADPVTILDYGCGCGYDGELFLQAGLQVSFADVPCMGIKFLRWRLAKWRHAAPVYSLSPDVIVPQHDVVWAIDVLEHIPQAQQRDFLLTLEQLGRTAIVTLVDDKKADGTIHYPVYVEGLCEDVKGRRRCWWQDYHEQTDGSRVRLLVIGEWANRLS